MTAYDRFTIGAMASGPAAVPTAGIGVQAEYRPMDHVFLYGAVIKPATSTNVLTLVSVGLEF